MMTSIRLESQKQTSEALTHYTPEYTLYIRTAVKCSHHSSHFTVAEVENFMIEQTNRMLSTVSGSRKEMKMR